MDGHHSPSARNPALLCFQPLDGLGPMLPPGDYPGGSPRARAAGHPSSLAAVYCPDPSWRLPDPSAPMTAHAARMRFLRWLSLGEGGTPLLPLPTPMSLGSLDVKAEWMNPTGSHKDRMSSLAVARALELDARGVACASSGNAGVSLAAYAARAGMACTVVIGAAVHPNFRARLVRYGASLVTAPDGTARWAALADLAAEGWHSATNFHLPAAGSCAWAVEGLRSLAFELAAARPTGLDVVVAPAARGDLLQGLARGFAELQTAGLWPHPVPRLIATEPFPRLSLVLRGAAEVTDDFPGQTRQASVAGATSTDQAVDAVRRTGGTAIVVSDAEAFAARATLAREQGMLLESCAAATLAALPGLLARGLLRPGDRVVLIGTAAGLHEPDPDEP